MFCFQCEQTAGCTGCKGRAGVCGKSSYVANLQDELTGALIALARCANKSKPTSSTSYTMIEGLFKTITNVNFDGESVKGEIEKVHREKDALISQHEHHSPTCKCSIDYDMKKLWTCNEDIRSL
ncbi:MAG TPA: hydroxylamine reductase, partial [Clostridiaceae bacterium]|nr:hydroxylamine reductase [Clostridiaceae bacterium]